MKNILVLRHQITGVYIYFCYGLKKYEKCILKEFGETKTLESDGETTIFMADNAIVAIVIGVRKMKDIYSLKGVVVHEISHTVSEIMKCFNFECDEFRSYNNQWLYQEIIEFLDSRLEDDK